MDGLDKLFYTSGSDTLKAAKFMYAVMAKNKFTDPSCHCTNLKGAATDLGGIWPFRSTIYQLEENTWKNILLLGLDTLKIKRIEATDVQNHPDIIITSFKHSVYASSGTYDEYGTPTPVSDFSGKHRAINQQENYILVD